MTALAVTMRFESREDAAVPVAGPIADAPDGDVDVVLLRTLSAGRGDRGHS
jgi:hypothetical protein